MTQKNEGLVICARYPDVSAVTGQVPFGGLGGNEKNLSLPQLLRIMKVRGHSENLSQRILLGDPIGKSSSHQCEVVTLQFGSKVVFGQF